MTIPNQYGFPLNTNTHKENRPMKIHIKSIDAFVELDTLLHAAKEEYDLTVKLPNRVMNHDDGSFIVPVVKMTRSAYCGYLEQIIGLAEALKSRT
jgi:hypothetical protein